MPEKHKQPPTNVKEVGIHIGYLREDIADYDARIFKLEEIKLTQEKREI